MEIKLNFLIQKSRIYYNKSTYNNFLNEKEKPYYLDKNKIKLILLIINWVITVSLDQQVLISLNMNLLNKLFV